MTGNEWNPDDAGRRINVFKIDGSAPHPYLMPGADPGEGFFNTNFQLFSTDDPAPRAVPTNQGFVINFKAAIQSDEAKGFKDTLPGTAPSEIMGMYAPAMLPIMSALARGFAVCDQWFASVPTQTIPNRTFAAAATSQGHLDNHVKVFTCPSIFGRLTGKNIDWAIYGYNRDPLTRLDFTDTQHADERHFGHFRDFQTRCGNGTLPAYTFLEPSFSASGNSQHPNYDVALGEQLIHDTYYAVKNGPGWNDTLLLITYDEHGGNYDHVAPPSNAIPPDNSIGEFNFDFKRFGVRIPALLISPRIAAGTVFRAKRGTIDHTSVLKTIELRWGLDPLTERDKAAAQGRQKGGAEIQPALTAKERPRRGNGKAGSRPPRQEIPRRRAPGCLCDDTMAATCNNRFIILLRCNLFWYAGLDLSAGGWKERPCTERSRTTRARRRGLAWPSAVLAGSSAVSRPMMRVRRFRQANWNAG